MQCKTIANNFLRDNFTVEQYAFRRYFIFMGFLFYLFQLFLNGMRLRPDTQLLARCFCCCCSLLFCEVFICQTFISAFIGNQFLSPLQRKTTWLQEKIRQKRRKAQVRFLVCFIVTNVRLEPVQTPNISK